MANAVIVETTDTTVSFKYNSLKAIYRRTGELRARYSNDASGQVSVTDTVGTLGIGKELFPIDLNTDTIDIDGVTVFANVDELINALGLAFLGQGQNVTTDLQNRIIINQLNVASILSSPLDSTKEYFIDGTIDVSGLSFDVPSNGLLLKGYAFDKSKILSSEDNYDLFVGANAGNIFLRSLSIEINGSNSRVFNVTSNTGFDAVELTEVNFDNCSSLGQLINYRQGLEINTGRFGSTPEIELVGNWVGGYRVDTSIVRGLSNITALFKAGAGFVYGGRVIININADLPAAGALTDFSPSNITNNESLIFSSCYVTRQGGLNTMDAGINPNITEKSIKSLWKGNVGVPNTQKFIKQNITTEVLTVISSPNTFEVLLGTWTVEAGASHFDSPANGQLRLLTGNGKYILFGDLSIEGGQGDDIEIRVVRSSDDGVTFPDVLDSLVRPVNSLVGGRDVALFPLKSLVELKSNDRVRLEVANRINNRNVTLEDHSSLIITEV